MALRIKVRRDTVARWHSVNPLLLLGEIGVEIESLQFKVGDGVSRWDDLPYMLDTEGAVVNSEIMEDAVNSLLVGGSGINLSYNDTENKLTINTSGLVIGTNIQAYDTTLSGIAALNPVSGNYIYATGNNLFTTGTITSFGRDIIGSSSSSDARSTLGLGSISTKASGDYALSSHTHPLSIGNGTSGVISYLTSDRLDIVGSGDTSVSYNDSSNRITISSIAPTLSNETIDDRVAALLISGTGISLNYNDTANSLTINTSGINRLGNTSKISVGGTYSVGVGLDNTSRTLSQNNTLSIMGGTVGIQTLTPVYELDIVGTVRSTESVSTVIKPTISSSQNNWDPGDGAIIRVSASNSSLNITGLVAGVDGQRKLLYNGGTRDITLVNSSSSSSTSNRFLTFSGSNYILNPNSAVELLYDSTSARWRIFGFVDAPTSTGGGGYGD